jgi:hypothetical protein
MPSVVRDADQLKHLVQRDAGQLLQILLRRVVWANLGPANLERLIDFGHKELHRSAPLHVDEAANWTMLFMATWKQPHAPRCRAASCTHGISIDRFASIHQQAAAV